MKPFLLFIFLSFLFSISAFGQSHLLLRHGLRASLNYALLEGKQRGIIYSGDYAYAINKHFSLVPGIMAGKAVSYNKTNFSMQAMMGTTCMVRVTPFAHSFDRFKFDLGFHYLQLTEASGSFSVWLENDDQHFTQIGSFSHGHQFGLNYALSLNLLQSAFFEGGIKIDRYLPLTRHPYQEAWHLGVYFGRKF